MDIERVNSVNAQWQNLVSILLTATCWGSEDSYIYILQVADILHNLILCQLGGLVLSAITTHDTSYFKVGSGLESLKRILTDVAVTYYGCSDFLHVLFILLMIISMFAVAKVMLLSRIT